jgi:hypothetical protein
MQMLQIPLELVAVQKISGLIFTIVSVVGLSACSSSESPNASLPSVVAPSASASSAQSPQVEPSADAAQLPDVSAPEAVLADSDAVIAWEALMSPVGEYAAAAMYQAVIDKFGAVEPYVTIKAAEERHISALTRQLVAFGVDVPQNPYLGVVAAPADLTAAAQAWAIGEIDNVVMYDKLLASASGYNLIRVLNNLRISSLESHLPMFTLAAQNDGVLTAEQMTAIRTG